MIIVSGLNRQTGGVRSCQFAPGKEGDARKFRSRLRSFGYTTAFVNDVKERYAERALDNECGFEIEGGVNIGESLVKFPYKVHSINTVNQQFQGSHIGFVKTLAEAEGRAAGCVKSWASDHPGVVIFKAIKLVRMRPEMSPLEFIDL